MRFFGKCNSFMMASKSGWILNVGGGEFIEINSDSDHLCMYTRLPKTREMRVFNICMVSPMVFMFHIVKVDQKV